MNYLDYKILKATQEHLDIIYPLEITCFEFPWSKKLLFDELSGENSNNFLLLDSNNELVGYIFSILVLDEIHIHSLAISPDFQNQGFGSFLLTEILNKAKTSRIAKAFLEVRLVNFTAVSFYKKIGFTEDFPRKSYYSNGDDALVMSKQLQL